MTLKRNYYLGLSLGRQIRFLGGCGKNKVHTVLAADLFEFVDKIVEFGNIGFGKYKEIINIELLKIVILRNDPADKS